MTRTNYFLPFMASPQVKMVGKGAYHFSACFTVFHEWIAGPALLNVLLATLSSLAEKGG
jgi:hypothetical protein